MRGIAGLMVLLFLAAPGAVMAQASSQQFAESLARLAESGASPQTLWNQGFMFFNQYPPSAELAATVAQAYQGVAGSNAAQEEVLRKAAAYWAKRSRTFGGDYVNSIHAPDRDHQYTRYRGEWESTLPMSRPQGPGAIVTPRRPR